MIRPAAGADGVRALSTTLRALPAVALALGLDSLEIGNGDQAGPTADRRRSQLTLWAMAASPLLLGTDLSALNATDRAMLAKGRILAVDQDGVAAQRGVSSGPGQVFSKRPGETRLIRARPTTP
ncbi:hypothetical protein ACIBCO_15730 [Streptomyces violascens]|uniref:hypothetical protein n=1 Tax=Streptomyces violascens TaxID=67381 RepID=UPI003788CA25